MSTLNLHSTVVRMIASGRVLRDSMKRSELAEVFSRHDDLVRHMAQVVDGTPVKTLVAGRMQSTIYVRRRPLIEIVSS